MLCVVLGASPSLKSVQDYVDVYWKGHVPIVQVLQSGIFMIKFLKEEDLAWVLDKGPWMIEGTKPFML